MAATRSKRPQYADILDVEPTYRQIAYREFIETHTGYEADLKTLQIANMLVDEFRASKEYGDAELARERERNARIAEKEAKRAERLATRAEKLRAQLAKVEAALPADAKPVKAAAKKAAARPLAVVPDAPKATKPRGAARKAAAVTAPPAPVEAPASSVIVDPDDDF